MFKRSFAILLALSTACLVPAFAGNGDPPAEAGRNTTWVQRTVRASQGECIWTYIVPVTTQRDDRTDDPAEVTSFFGAISTDAYAHTVAEGMQVWGYCWALDESSEDSSAGAAISSASLGGFRVLAAKLPEECAASIQAWWNPRSRLRAHMKRGLGNVNVGVLQEGEIPELELNVINGLDLSVTSDNVVTPNSGSITIAGVGGMSRTIASITSISTSPREMTILRSMTRKKGISQAHVSYVGSVWMSAGANRMLEAGVAESEGFVWDSVPGLEIDAKCLLPCQGSITVQYGFGM